MLVRFFLLILAIGGSCHKCSYQVPTVDEVVLGVPLELDDIGSRSRRDTFQPLRIRLFFDESIANLTVEKQLFINSSLVPEAVGYWSQALMVRRSSAPIRLSRKCLTSHYYIRQGEKQQACATGCKDVTTCGETPVPDSHLYQCRYCESSNPLTCSVSGPADGPGVGDTDFLLYVSAVASDRCQNPDTVAYAAHCQQEADFDRPIAGHVNLCPSGVSTAAHDQEVLMSTVKHEILHALGFSAGLYAFFRDDNGQPRTKRNQYNKPVSLNKERGFYDWDESTIRSVVRENWWTKNGPVPHRLQMMITPRVRAEAVRHFGCSELEGVELENQGGDGTALTHWEKRLLENEAMTGTHTQNPAYSRITFALMEDSGWYQANYDIAEPLSWGQGLGCDFAKRSCGDWMQLRKSRGLTPAPFCETVKHDGVESRATTTCTDMRDSLALCNLVPYNQPLQAEYLNYVHLNGIDDKEVDRYGGSVELADFCAYNQEFEWKSAMGGASGRRDSRCEIETNTPTDDSNAALETYGNRSRCFGHSGKWTQRKCGRMRTFAQYGAGCYEYICLDGRLYLDVLNGTDVYPCYHAGQRIAIRRVLNGWLHEGTVVCPACSELCQPNPGFAGCDPETTPPRPVGDPVLPEPCSAPSRYISLILLLSAIVLNAPFSSLFQCS